MFPQNRRSFLIKALAPAFLLFVTAQGLTCDGAQSQEARAEEGIHVHVTAGNNRYASAESLQWKRVSSKASTNTIVLDPAKRHQPILGFGAALTDAACYTINQMPEAAREELLKELFDPSQMNFSVCRLAIGSSDYARSIYSYDEGEPDPQLARFSIEHDYGYILPVIHRARQVNPDLFLLASPWSPPNWMKDNGSMLGGTIRKRYLEAYAGYVVKFLRAYQEKGVEVNAVTPQNEVDTDQDSRMPACLFPQEIEVLFVAKYLGPAIEHAGLNTKIWLLDHNYNLWGRAIAELDDPEVNRYTKSIAWHGYIGKAEWIQKVATAHPDAEMYWTEGGPRIDDPNYASDWSAWSSKFTEILRNGNRCIISWNLALDETGKPNIGPFQCGGLVTIQSQTNQVIRSGQYWAFTHYSRAIKRNAVVIESEGLVPEVSHLAVVNPDGQYVAVLTNSGKAASTVQLRKASNMVEVNLPADSVTTLEWK